MSESLRPAARMARTLRRWFDAGEAPVWQQPDAVRSEALVQPSTTVRPSAAQAAPERVDLPRIIPFIALHLGCLAVFLVGWSPFAIGVALVLYLLRMFAITGFYHRYFSHRAFRTSRAFQFVMAFSGSTAVQRGPLWWAAHHRHHHAYSDEEPDAHSPRRRGFWWSHVLWFLTQEGFATRTRFVKDWHRFPELRFIDRFDWVGPALLAGGLYGLGVLCERTWPEVGTSGAQLVVWGFCVSTVLVYHATYTINSLAHRFGSQPYATGDDSRNNGWLALLTLGEGWHNNHHYYPRAARQGFRWWEIDLTYYALRALAWCGLIWGLQPVPQHVLAERCAAAPRPPRVPGPTGEPGTRRRSGSDPLAAAPCREGDA